MKWSLGIAFCVRDVYLRLWNFSIFVNYTQQDFTRDSFQCYATWEYVLVFLSCFWCEVIPRVRISILRPRFSIPVLLDGFILFFGTFWNHWFDYFMWDRYLIIKYASCMCTIVSCKIAFSRILLHKIIDPTKLLLLSVFMGFFILKKKQSGNQSAFSAPLWYIF